MADNKQAAASELVLLLGIMAAQAAHIAHVRRALYDAYLAEGFSEQQALHLCERLTLS